MDAFGSVTVCMYRDDWQYSSYEMVDESENRRVLEFETTKQQSFYLLFDFYNPRMYPMTCKKH